jgi:DNA-binding XRE family transcriptional regulator
LTYRAPVSPAERARLKRQAYLRDIGVGGYTDAAPIQSRIRFLHDELGITYDTIADRSGADVETVKMHYRGFRWPDKEPVTTCVKETERKILGARFTPADGYKFPAVGIRRRLQALQAAGFTLAVVAELTEKDIRQVHATMSGKTNKHFVTTPFAQAVITAYEKLETADPKDWGVKPQAYGQAKTRAKANGYVGPGCWDDDTIDDPDALPEYTGSCGTSAGWEIHKRDKIPLCPPCEAAGDGKPHFSGTKLRALREKAGYSRRMITDRLGMDESTIFYWETGRSTPRRKMKLDLVLQLLDATYEDVCE